MNKIEIHTLDKDGDISTCLDHFDTVKDAKVFVKECGLMAGYWDQRAESQGWAGRNIETIQLLVNGECRKDWFPEFL